MLGDLIFLGVVAMFFAITWALVRWFDALGGRR